MEFIERPQHFYQYTVMDEGSKKIIGHTNTLSEAIELAGKHTNPNFIPHIYENKGFVINKEV